ncbi:MAG: T9SS type A sorting domain-containing protein [Brumimicrobium sp.]
MNKLITLIFTIIVGSPLYSQSFDYYKIGDTTNVNVNHNFGICLMGGATENEDGATWFLNNSGGGNIVVLRASGGDGYQNYFYSDLGVSVQSVETIVFNDISASNDPFVLDRIEKAEAIWIAGGDQYAYETLWKGNAVETLINNHINVKQAPIGGTSAGMAILGDYYFSAENGTITSNEALNNPFDLNLTIGSAFIQTPFLENTITDTHYDNPDRKGRHLTFIARMLNNNSNEDYFGIASDEFVAICIDSNGIAQVFGEHPEYDDNAYFLRTNCQRATPAVIQADTPLTWEVNDGAVIVCNIKGTIDGSNKFDLNQWLDIIGGTWEEWSVDQGNLTSQNVQFNGCTSLVDNNNIINEELIVYPNPTSSSINVKVDAKIKSIEVLDANGKVLTSNNYSTKISLEDITNGIYTLRIKTTEDLILHKKFTLIN